MTGGWASLEMTRGQGSARNDSPPAGDNRREGILVRAAGRGEPQKKEDDTGHPLFVSKESYSLKADFLIC